MAELSAAGPSIVEISDLSVIAPSTPRWIETYGTLVGPGVRSIRNSYLEGQTFFAHTGDYQLHYNIFAGTDSVAPIASGNTATVAADMNWVFNHVRAAATPSGLPGGTWSRTVLTRNAVRNPHFASFRWGGGHTTINGAILAYDGTDGSGDGFQLESAPPTPTLFTVTGVIVLPNANRTAGSASIVTVSPRTTITNAQILVAHNTAYAGVNAGGIATGGVVIENITTTGHPLFVGIRYNLLWRDTKGPGRLIFEGGAPQIAPNTYQRVEYNAYWNIDGSPYTAGQHYSDPAVPGLGDIPLDPYFVDPTRHIVAWARTVGYEVSSIADVAQLFRSHAASMSTLVSMYDWIRSGFRPVNTALTYRGALAADVVVIGDINRDNSVNCVDITIARSSFGKRTGEIGFAPSADLNEDGIVDILDLARIYQQLAPEMECE
jgi:hypothetical protein